MDRLAKSGYYPNRGKRRFCSPVGLGSGLPKGNSFVSQNEASKEELLENTAQQIPQWGHAQGLEMPSPAAQNHPFCCSLKTGEMSQIQRN
jgi:hypothetical protein